MERLSQIAMSVTDLRRTHQWYLDVLGFVPGGGTETFKGWFTEKVQGVPGARTTCWWLVDRQEYFQLELFQYHRPKARPLGADWRPSDIGYTTVGIHVADFDATIERARAFGSAPFGETVGEPGARRVCVRDPEGVLLELMEDDLRGARPRLRPRPEVPAVVRSVTLSVPDLQQSARFFVDALGLEIAEDVSLHGPEHEALWGLSGAKRHSLVLWADDMLVELVQYLDPIGKPQSPEYYISDQGLLNIAFGFRTRRQLVDALRRVRSVGAKPNWILLDLGNWGVVYVNDVLGFSVELLYVRPWYDRAMGFLPASPDSVIERTVTIDAPVDRVWERLVDTAAMGEWWPNSVCTLLEEGEDTNGPGAVRSIRSGFQELVERVVAWDPGKRLDYRLISGAPIRNHFGRVVLAADGDATTLTWRIRFTVVVPGTGWLLARVIGRMLDRALGNLNTLCHGDGSAQTP